MTSSVIAKKKKIDKPKPITQTTNINLEIVILMWVSLIEVVASPSASFYHMQSNSDSHGQHKICLEREKKKAQLNIERAE